MEKTDMKISNIIQQVNDLKIDGLPFVEDEEVADILGKPVATGLDRDERRWYVLSTDVYRVGESFIGLRGVSGLKSESMSISDVGIPVIAVEMEAVQSVTYQEKRQPTPPPRGDSDE